jgi:hypothetical protein
MDTIRSVIRRIGVGTCFVGACIMVFVLVLVGAFMTVNYNRDAHTSVLNSIVDGCKGSPDFAKCVAAASTAAGINTTEQNMQKYIVEKCFNYHSGSERDRCVAELIQALK